MVVAFGRVIENHIQDDLNTCLVQGLDELLELIHLHAKTTCGCIASLGCEEPYGAVTPKVVESFTGIGV